MILRLYSLVHVLKDAICLGSCRFLHDCCYVRIGLCVLVLLVAFHSHLETDKLFPESCSRLDHQEKLVTLCFGVVSAVPGHGFGYVGDGGFVFGVE